MMNYQTVGLTLFVFNVVSMLISAVGYILLKSDRMIRIRLDITNIITWMGLLGRSMLLMLNTLDLTSICWIEHIARILIIHPLIGPVIQAYKLYHRYQYHRRLSERYYNNKEDANQAKKTLIWILEWKHSFICYLCLHIPQLLLNMTSFLYIIIMESNECSPWLNLASDALYICLLLIASIMIVWNLNYHDDLNWIKKEYLMLGTSDTIGITSVILFTLSMNDIGNLIFQIYFMIIGVIIFTIPTILSLIQRKIMKPDIILKDTVIDIKFETNPSLNQLMKTSLTSNSIDEYMSHICEENPTSNYALQFLKDFAVYSQQKKNVGKIGRAHLIYQKYLKNDAYLHLPFLDLTKLDNLYSIIKELHTAVEKIPEHTDPKVDCSPLINAMNELRRDVENYIIVNIIGPYIKSADYRNMIRRIGTAQEVLDIEFIVSSEE